MILFKDFLLQRIN